MSLFTSIRRPIARNLATFCAALVLIATATPASAATFNVGPETVVRHLQDVRLQNGSGEPLYLGYKVTYHWFGLPYAVSADGFVLAVKDKPVRYDLEEARVAEWQAQGYLPSPLPVYRMSAADYVFGYLMWIVGGALSVWYGAKALISRRKAKRAAPLADESSKAVAAAMAKRANQQVVLATAKPQGVQPAPVQSAPVQPAAQPAARSSLQSPRPPEPKLQPQVLANAERPKMERPKVQPQIETLKQPSPRPLSKQVTDLSQTMVTAMRLPVARTLCRVKALKVA